MSGIGWVLSVCIDLQKGIIGVLDTVTISDGERSRVACTALLDDFSAVLKCNLGRVVRARTVHHEEVCFREALLRFPEDSPDPRTLVASGDEDSEVHLLRQVGLEASSLNGFHELIGRGRCLIVGDRGLA